MESQKRIEEDDERKPPRVLCLHGFRTSGEILKKQVLTKWPDSVVKKLDLVFIDAPFPSQGKSGVEGFYGPPYYERYQFEKIRVYGFIKVFSPACFESSYSYSSNIYERESKSQANIKKRV
ncbi:uncharacterized protein LOC113316935 isoform X2 [Papaver somniferum]|nr:uncharacterized protein LOC113316935 isoform X2 [Papaver somniferum]XP_026420882.1 uncharacterized protein LOC113316935 isoform X2 [Papaver somniferum]